VRNPIIEHLTALADTTRNRILLLLERQEMTVSELCAVMQLPQSTVSRHLKALADSEWVTARGEGTSHLYTMARQAARSTAAQNSGATRTAVEESEDGLEPTTRRLWLLVREQAGATAAAVQDQQRLQSVLAKRRARSQEFFSSAAGQWDRYRDDLFGDRFHLAALAALADRRWVVGDLGCGTGHVSAALAPFVARVVAVDASAQMLQAARARVGTADNVDLRRGELESLPIDDERLDLATLMLVLHHVPDPAVALKEVARVLKAGGRLLLVDMLPHERENYRQQMGHVWLGFAEDHMRQLMTDAGFTDIRIIPLVPDALAKGPGLFTATGVKSPTHVNKE
jgi:ubiquinone/menaquinone biosynthesis C-methylase UbiE/DNA-binding transcriptional ArsR family regulator